MILKLIVLFVSVLTSVISTQWTSYTECPTSCLCREEHFSDLSIARFTQTTNEEDSLSTDYQITNDIFYDDNFNHNQENPLLRVAVCSLQTETNVDDFILSLPKSIQALSIVKSSDSGNKTFYTSFFNYFDELIVLDLHGSQASVNDSFILEIDGPVTTLQYFNIEQIYIKNSEHQVKLAVDENEEIEIKLDTLTMVQKKIPDSEILPYYKYKEVQNSLESPLFVDFINLVLVRIFDCNLQDIQWEMFDGLQNLKILILENNNLKFIPSFAFYGTPNLYKLSLARNSLLNIQITDLAGLLELEYLDLSHNNFSQLSELSFPPFPKLKVADFRDNPITVVFPNTFDIMNTTDSIILGGDDTLLRLLPNSFSGLSQLIKLHLKQVDVPLLKQELLTGMPILKELTITGNINKIEFDAFVEVPQLEKLILNNCNLYNLSMDAFYGLQNLLILDLSRNHLKYLPPNLFDDQIQLKELLLHGNELTELPKGIFSKIPAKLIRLNENPWHCSCVLSDWDPMVINKIKQKILTPCHAEYSKGFDCKYEKKYAYIYDNRLAPKCYSPSKLNQTSVFQAIRRNLRCKDHKLKFKKFNSTTTSTKHPIIDRSKKIKFNNDALTIGNDLNHFDLKRIQIKNNERNDLLIHFNNMLNIPPAELYYADNIGINKGVPQKKDKQRLKTLAKLKKLKKEHKEM